MLLWRTNSVCSDMIIKGEIYLLMAYLIKNHTSVRLSQSEYNTRINRIEKINSFYAVNEYCFYVLRSFPSNLCAAQMSFSAAKK